MRQRQPLSETVFWPKGCKTSGVCYGWLNPSVCVVGVLDEGMNALPVSLLESESFKAIEQDCAGEPTIIGQCRFDTASPFPDALTISGCEGNEFSFVLYDCDNPQSLRFYVMEPLSDHKRVTQLTNHEKAINDVVLNQINASSLVQSLVHSSPPKFLPVTASALLKLASHLGSLSATLLSLSNYVTRLTNAPVNPFAPTTRLKDVSAIGQQIDVRIEQAVFFITNVTTLDRKNTHDTASYSVRYTNFFNTVWLMMNDFTLGLFMGAFLSENNVALAAYTNLIIQSWLFDFPSAAVYWLDSWPAGLKLNAQLSTFYVNIFIGVIDSWRHIFPPVTPYLFTVLSLLTSFGGLTLLLAVLSDLLSLFVTAHLRIVYEFSRVVYWAAGVRLGGGLLWGVFRGKRQNILRKRTDTWTYDIDQLLFGTMLFTLIAFLFPTALVYYVLFAGIRLATLLAQASIETLLAFMHHFPLFALLLRIKEPGRLPGGIYFTLQIHPASERSYLKLEKQPISISAIFFQYIELWQRLAGHYNPLRLLYQVLAGQHLSSIPQYSIRYEVPRLKPAIERK